MGGVPEPLRKLGTAAGIFFGEVITVSLASSLTIRLMPSASEAKRRYACADLLTMHSFVVCRKKVRHLVGKGFSLCKLCKGNSKVECSPLYDHVAIIHVSSLYVKETVMCLLLSFRVQRCLNCLGKGYS
ncbi:hypothetical protein MKW94_013437 [Papaver nudicaule]|uniref:Uncharacterized protein n=1 Tax=Papaver nudicaule TaxID=74823 RepID=A0AA41SC97_PAPNU|nr:hypothetical protein [Papaver nudicaule]